MIYEFLTVILIIIWGLQHSFFASSQVKNFLGVDAFNHYYRIFFIIIGLLTYFTLEVMVNNLLVPFGELINPIIQTTDTTMIIFLTLMNVIGWFIAIGAFIQTNPLIFVGVKRESNNFLKTNGFYRFSRHPIYWGVLLSILSLLLTTNNSVFFVKYLNYILYLLIGAKLEEKRLKSVLMGYEIMFSRGFLFPFKKSHFLILLGKEK